jgi:anti-sigma factor RsiW
MARHRQGPSFFVPAALTAFLAVYLVAPAPSEGPGEVRREGVAVETGAPVYFRNCAAARAAGAAPIYAGRPGYREQLDRDGDGIACEPYRGW